MNAVTLDALRALYEPSDDPWNFRHSRYEQDKYDETLAVVGDRRFEAILEVGCGNGELAARFAGLTDRYVGVDAVATAIRSARQRVPDGEFHECYLPCELPAGPFSLIVLSEVLYFLDADGIDQLARQLASRWSDAELLCVNWLGPTLHALQGVEALARLSSSLPVDWKHRPRWYDARYRIDSFQRQVGTRAR